MRDAESNTSELSGKLSDQEAKPIADINRVLESVQAGKRLPETPFTNLKVASKSQQSIYSMFQKSNGTGSSEGGFYRGGIS